MHSAALRLKITLVCCPTSISVMSLESYLELPFIQRGAVRADFPGSIRAGAACPRCHPWLTWAGMVPQGDADCCTHCWQSMGGPPGLGPSQT